MNDLIVAIGLVFVIEGLVYALIPAQMRNMVAEMVKLPDSTLRLVGLASLAIGVFVVWMVRGGGS